MYFTVINKLNLAVPFPVTSRPLNQTLFPAGNRDQNKINTMKLGNRRRQRATSNRMLAKVN